MQRATRFGCNRMLLCASAADSLHCLGFIQGIILLVGHYGPRYDYLPLRFGKFGLPSPKLCPAVCQNDMTIFQKVGFMYPPRHCKVADMLALEFIPVNSKQVDICRFCGPVSRNNTGLAGVTGFGVRSHCSRRRGCGLDSDLVSGRLM